MNSNAKQAAFVAGGTARVDARMAAFTFAPDPASLTSLFAAADARRSAGAGLAQIFMPDVPAMRIFTISNYKRALDGEQHRLENDPSNHPPKHTANHGL